MDHFPVMVVAVVLAGLAFDFVNGFHDAANSIATIVATRVLKPWQAVLWAAFFNVIAFFFFGVGVAKTVGAGLISLDTVTPMVVFCGLVGATLWGIITWRFGIPTSSSHALLGGYAGAAMGNSALHKGWQSFGDPIIGEGWTKVLAFIVVAPTLGFCLAYVSIKILNAAEKAFSLTPNNKFYRHLQLASSAFLSLMHGSNDAQKTAGIIAGAMLAAGLFSTFTVPIWVLVASYIMMGLGTLFGGWRIVRTMGQRLTKLTPQGGVCAESASAVSIFAATLFNLPISTTHVTTGAILGVGTASNPRHVHWRVGRRIAWAWLLTIPAAALMGFCVMAVAFICGG